MTHPRGALVTLSPTCNRERRMVALHGAQWRVLETSSKGLSVLLAPYSSTALSPCLWASIAKCAVQSSPMGEEQKDPL